MKGGNIIKRIGKKANLVSLLDAFLLRLLYTKEKFENDISLELRQQQPSVFVYSSNNVPQGEVIISVKNSSPYLPIVTDKISVTLRTANKITTTYFLDNKKIGANSSQDIHIIFYLNDKQLKEITNLSQVHIDVIAIFDSDLYKLRKIQTWRGIKCNIS